MVAGRGAGMTTLADWSTAPDWAQWYAIDSNGYGNWFMTKPFPVEGHVIGFWTFRNGVAMGGYWHNLKHADWHTAIEQRPQEAR